MTFKKHPYKGIVFKALPSSIDSAEQEYSTLFEVECDIETSVNNTHSVQNRKIYNYTHDVWMWNDATVTYKDSEDNILQKTLLEFIEESADTPFKEGYYFKSSIRGKEISGEIKLYDPSQLGVFLGIDTNKV